MRIKNMPIILHSVVTGYCTNVNLFCTPYSTASTGKKRKKEWSPVADLTKTLLQYSTRYILY